MWRKSGDHGSSISSRNSPAIPTIQKLEIQQQFKWNSRNSGIQGNSRNSTMSVLETLLDTTRLRVLRRLTHQTPMWVLQTLNSTWIPLNSLNFREFMEFKEFKGIQGNSTMRVFETLLDTTPLRGLRRLTHKISTWKLQTLNSTWIPWIPWIPWISNFWIVGISQNMAKVLEFYLISIKTYKRSKLLKTWIFGIFNRSLKINDSVVRDKSFMISVTY